ncbi:MAG: polysaccharide biosynthesis C-terminal domain-containing protein [Thermoleophilaceae bacterium]
MSDNPTGPPAAGGGQARLLAVGSLTQQLAQVSGLLAMFAIITVLARRLSLAELGVYGLLSSLAGYLLVIQNAAANAALRTMGGALGPERRQSAFSAAALVFAAAGLLTGLLVAVVGVVLSLAVDLSDDLRGQAVRGSLLLGAVTAVGWPLTVFRDALRASQLFVRAALMDVAGLAFYAALMLGLLFADASLVVLIAASGTIPLFAGLASLVSVRVARLPFRLKLRAVRREDVRELLGLAGYVSAAEAAGAVMYAFDRAILGLFSSVATVALFEGPVRAHNLVRAFNGAVGVTALPTASKYLAEGDDARLRELLLRGTRYMLAFIVPLTVTGMVLAGPVLEVWLGAEFREGAAAMAILLSYWLVTGSVGVGAAIVIAAGRAGVLARYAWIAAIANLAISLALTPLIGLEGVAIGTTVPYLVAFPFTLRLIRSVVPVSLANLAREVWVPAYTSGLVLAAALGAVRLTTALDSVPAVLGVGAGGLLAYWIAFYALWLRPDERALVRGLVPGASRGV